MTYRRTPAALRYALSVASAGLALAVALATWPLFESVPFMLFYGAVMFSSWFGGWKAGALTAVLSALASEYFLIEPRFAVIPPDPASALRLLGFLTIAGLMAFLSERLHIGQNCLEANDAALRAGRERLEDALRENAAVTESLVEGLVVLDADGRFTHLNPAAEQLLGWTRVELIGREMHGTVHDRREDGGDYPVEECPIQLARALGAAQRGEETLVRRDGTFVPVAYSISPLRVDGAVTGQVFAFSDISERRRAENALRETAERLGLALDAGRLGTWDWNPATNRVTWSPSLEAIFGLAPGGYDGTFEAFAALIHPADREQVLQTIEESSRRGGDHYVRHRVILPNGAVRWVEGYGKAVQDAQGRTVRMVGVCVDVTEREEAAETIHQLNQSLERNVLARTAALQETIGELESFSYSISHDLRAPVRAVRGYADAMLEEGPDDPDNSQITYARRIAEAAGHMDALIQDLLAYGRLSRSEFQPEPVSLGLAAADAVRHMTQEIAEHGAEVVLEVDPAHSTVLGHRATVFQIISNLLSNAIRFVPEGRRPSIRIRAERSDPNVRLWVEDNGIGIEPRHQERIFRVFERLHPLERYPGTGVGLAIVRRGVERMGGRVGVESEPGAGSRFWIELPALR